MVEQPTPLPLLYYMYMCAHGNIGAIMCWPQKAVFLQEALSLSQKAVHPSVAIFKPAATSWAEPTKNNTIVRHLLSTPRLLPNRKAGCAWWYWENPNALPPHMIPTPMYPNNDAHIRQPWKYGMGKNVMSWTSKLYMVAAPFSFLAAV